MIVRPFARLLISDAGRLLFTHLLTLKFVHIGTIEHRSYYTTEAHMSTQLHSSSTRLEMCYYLGSNTFDNLEMDTLTFELRFVLQNTVLIRAQVFGCEVLKVDLLQPWED